MHFLSEITTFIQVVLIDLALAGDNAVVVGMAAASVDAAVRQKVIFWGIGGAVILRAALAIMAVELLQITGLTLAGGLLLLWVCWKMLGDIKGDGGGVEVDGGGAITEGRRYGSAIVRIIVADLSMSLDNVLAVAGAARDDVGALVAGLLISIGLMAVAATLIARLIARYRIISWLGLAIVLIVALDMIWRGTHLLACPGVSFLLCSAA